MKTQYVHRWNAGDSNVKTVILSKVIHHSNISPIKIPEESYCSKYNMEKKWPKNNQINQKA